MRDPGRREVENYLDKMARRNERREMKEPNPLHLQVWTSEVQWDDPVVATGAMRQFLGEVVDFNAAPGRQLQI